MELDPEARIISLDGLDYYGGAVSQHFAYAAHHFRRVIPCADDGVRPDLASMLNHYLERLGARGFAQLRKGSNVAADYRLQRAPKRAEY
jgi:hypothetical protein